MKIAVIGNCHAGIIAQAVNAALPAEDKLDCRFIVPVESPSESDRLFASSSDHVLMQVTDFAGRSPLPERYALALAASFMQDGEQPRRLRLDIREACFKEKAAALSCASGSSCAMVWWQHWRPAAAGPARDDQIELQGKQRQKSLKVPNSATVRYVPWKRQL